MCGCMLVVGRSWRKTIFIENRFKHGFCWYCDPCQGGPDASGAAQSLVGIEDRVAKRVMSSVSQYLDTFRVSLSDRLTALEVAIGLVVTRPCYWIFLKKQWMNGQVYIKMRQLGLK